MNGWRDRPTLNLSEVSRVTGLLPRHVAELVKNGTLPTVVFAGQRLIRTKDVIRIFESATSSDVERGCDEMERRLR